MTNARIKGQVGEREAVNHLGEILGMEGLTRNLEQVRSGGGDILGIDGLVIEVKRQETLLVNTWWKQVCLAADREGCIPVLMYRRNREKWTYVLPAEVLVVGMPGKLTLGEPEFAWWLRKWVKV